MKNKFVLAMLLGLIWQAAFSQYNNRYHRIDNDEEMHSYLKLGTQIPFQHSIAYDHRITPSFSLNAGIGIIAAPYPNMILGSLENRNLITTDDRHIIERSFQSGITYQIGANIHFSRNYIRLFGQLAHLNADLTIPDLIRLYFRTDIPPALAAVGSFINPIDIKSNVPMGAILYGRRFPIGENSEIHAEFSVAKTLGHQTTYKTGTFLDNIEVVNDIVYNELDNDLDTFFKEYGWVPTLNVYYVFKF
jgi:hypothetical protein